MVQGVCRSISGDKNILLNVHIASNFYFSTTKIVAMFSWYLETQILGWPCIPSPPYQKIWSTICAYIVPNTSYRSPVKDTKTWQEKLFLKSTPNLSCCSLLFVLPTESMENTIFSSALQELFVYLKIVCTFLKSYSFSWPQLLQHVRSLRLSNLTVLCWNQLQLVHILLEVQHPNPKIFIQLNFELGVYLPTLLPSP